MIEELETFARDSKQTGEINVLKVGCLPYTIRGENLNYKAVVKDTDLQTIGVSGFAPSNMAASAWNG